MNETQAPVRPYRTSAGQEVPASQEVVTGGRLSTMLLRAVADALAVSAAVTLAGVLRFGFGILAVIEATPLTMGAHIGASGLWTAGLLAALYLNRLYDEDTLFQGGGELSRVLRATIETGAMLTTFVFFTQSFYVSRSWFGFTAMLSVLVLVAERLGVRAWLRRERASGRRQRRAILVSRDGRVWPEWSEEVGEFRVVGSFNPDQFTAYAAQVSAQEENSPGNLGEVAVVLRARDFSNDEFWRILLLSGEIGWPTFVHSPVRSVGRDRLSTRELGGHTIVKIGPSTLKGLRSARKRAFDAASALVLLFTLGPLMGLIALGVLLASGRPVLYKQERIGLHGRSFLIIKFRTMKKDAEQASGPVWASEDDRRRTPLGAWLRRTSLDELPQLWNVLRGDMSLVGPRPERPAFANEFTEQLTWYRFRHRIRPGITGWAQAHGLRGNTSLDSRVQFDNWYVEHWSITLDLKIIGRTLLEICRGRNAY